MDRNQGQKLIEQAVTFRAESPHIADDLSAALFPKSSVAISDRMRVHAQQYSLGMVTAIESEICAIAIEKNQVTNEAIISIAASGAPHCFNMLEKAGMLASKPLLDHIFVDAQVAELNAHLLQKTSQEDLENTLTQNLDDKDEAIADAAMALLVAHSRVATSRVSLSDLPAEIFHALAWPVLAGLENITKYSGDALKLATENMLGSHDESVSLHSRAGRLALLLGNSEGLVDENLHPLKDGLYLFLTRLSQLTELSVDQIVTFTAEPNMARLVIAMRAIEVRPKHALSILAALEGRGAIVSAASYNEIDVDAAKSLLVKWRMVPAYQEVEAMLSSQMDAAPRW